MNQAQTIDLASVKRGFDDPATESQHLFRLLMKAISEPGLLVDVSNAPQSPEGIYRATGGVALTLFDFETSIWLCESLRGGETEAWLRFHCNAPLVLNPMEAQFAVVNREGPFVSLPDFNQGDAKYPDRSTTLIIEVESFGSGETRKLSGPGIPGTRELSAEGLPEGFWQQVEQNSGQFQFGVDLFLCTEDTIVGLPRSTRVSS